MKKIAFFLFSPLLVLSQTIYDPQQMYDNTGGFFDEDSLRSVYINFYNSNYHNYLVNAWYYSSSNKVSINMHFIF